MHSAKRYFSTALALSLTTFLIAGCGGDKDNSSEKTPSASGAPTVEQLVNKAISNSGNETVGGEAKIDFSVKADTDDPQLAFLKEGISWSGKGYADKEFVDFKSNLKLGSQALAFDILADPKQSFIKLGQSWYGPNPGMDASNNSKDVDKLSSQLGLSGVPSDPEEAKKELEKAKELVNKYANQLFVGSVTEGPKVDSQDTWQFKGKIDADTIIKIVEEEADKKVTKATPLPEADRPGGVVPPDSPAQDKMSEEDKKAFKGLLDLFDVSMTFGKDDGLLHGLGLKFVASKEQLTSIEKLGSEGSTPSSNLPESIEISFDALTTSLEPRKDNSLTPPTGDIKSPEKLAQDVQTQIGALFLLGGMSMEGENNQDPSIDPNSFNQENMPIPDKS